MAKEQSGRNTLLFLSECGRGVDILNLFRCLISLLDWAKKKLQFFHMPPSSLHESELYKIQKKFEWVDLQLKF